MAHIPPHIVSLLQRNPQRCLDGARRGSLRDLTTLAIHWPFFPILRSMGLFTVFFHHLDEGKVPSPRSPASESLTESAYLSLFALSRLIDFHGQMIEDVDFALKALKAWPGIFKWSKFFFVTRILYPTHEETRYPCLQIITNAWCALEQIELLRRAITDTPGSVELATRIWLFEGTPQAIGDGHPVAATGGLYNIIHLDCKRGVDRVLNAAGGDVHKVAQQALSRLRMVLEGNQPDISHLRIVVHAVECLGPPIKTAMRDAFLAGNSILWMTTALVSISSTISRNPDPTTAAAMQVCLGYLGDHLNAKEGYPFVIQSINAGLIPALANCSPAMGIETSKNLEIAIIRNTLPRYVLYRPVLWCLHSALGKLKGSQSRQKVQASVIKDDWTNLEKVVEERYHDLSTPSENFCCDNKKCRKMGDKAQFRKCGSCSVAFYCAKECQVQDWREGNHKAKCKAAQRLAPEGATEKLGKRDFQFIKNQTLREAHRGIPALKMIAARDHPGVPYSRLVIVISYLVSPPSYTLEPLEGYTGVPRGCEDHMVVRAQSKPLIDTVKEDPTKHTLIESRVVFGEICKFVFCVASGNLLGDGGNRDNAS
ncbi:hypothetical protein JAAARDRAFT_190070 [Jaapia argillacea MUCL 33604]|uniref:MYND-type domain-containing protein n=1 Tax=Jaapia argillacea MUCL 33604 TaxID=933084 RepID=A0A067Q9F8_9AGAM|nr:hypothetical protein JAAARDRAFT_190070 [Jaapia argillacea MUCL 33604]